MSGFLSVANGSTPCTARPRGGAMAGTSVVQRQRQGNEPAPCHPVPGAVCWGVLLSRGTIQVSCTSTGVPGCCRSVTTLTPESRPPGVCLCMRKGGEGYPLVTLSPGWPHEGGILHKHNCWGCTFMLFFRESGTSVCIIQVASSGCALATRRICILPQ